MNKSYMKKNELTKIINKSIVDLPAPSNLSTWWNFGSLLGMCLILQLITGIMISMHYTSNTEMAFNSIMHIMRDVNYGWLLRMMHSNGASMLFLCLYMHTGRSMYYGSYKNKKTWNTGIIMMMMMMATAFMGYVLPWGQMSLWGATVITNLFSAVPYLGNMLVKWMWGGFSVNNATLTRFFSLHFMLPFTILMMSMIHIMFLHNKGSNNPMGTNSNMDKIPFHPFYSTKDLMGFSMTLYMFMMMNMSMPNMMNDPENYTKANEMITPIHIQPEWYFLFAYTILRSIPNKLGGVLSLMLSITILIIMPMTMKMKFKGVTWYPISQLMFWTFTMTTIMLTWIGSKPVEEPFSLMGKTLTLMYFSYFMMDPIMTKLWDKLIN